MTAEPASPSSPAVRPTTIAGHAVSVDGRAGGIVNLRIGLRGEPLLVLARALAKLDGVRVTGGAEGTGGGRCYIVSCPGFKMVLSSRVEDVGDVARGLVSREPPPPLAVLSELGSVLDGLMSPPLSSPPVTSGVRRRVDKEKERDATKGADPADDDARSSRSAPAPGASLPRSAIRRGQPLVRRTELRRKKPLARGPFRKG